MGLNANLLRLTLERGNGAGFERGLWGWSTLRTDRGHAIGGGLLSRQDARERRIQGVIKRRKECVGTGNTRRHHVAVFQFPHSQTKTTRRPGHGSARLPEKCEYDTHGGLLWCVEAVWRHSPRLL